MEISHKIINTTLILCGGGRGNSKKKHRIYKLFLYLQKDLLKPIKMNEKIIRQCTMIYILIVINLGYRYTNIDDL